MFPSRQSINGGHRPHLAGSRLTTPSRQWSSSALGLPRGRRDSLNPNPHIIRNRVLPYNSQHSLKCWIGSSTLLHSVNKVCSVITHQILEGSSADVGQDLITGISANDFLNRRPRLVRCRLTHLGKLFPSPKQFVVLAGLPRLLRDVMQLYPSLSEIISVIHLSSLAFLIAACDPYRVLANGSFPTVHSFSVSYRLAWT